MDRSTPGLRVHHQLPEFTQTHAHESVMPSNHLILCHPLLLLPSVLHRIRVFFQWVSSLHLVATVLELQVQHQLQHSSYSWGNRVSEKLSYPRPPGQRALELDLHPSSVLSSLGILECWSSQGMSWKEAARMCDGDGCWWPLQGKAARDTCQCQGVALWCWCPEEQVLWLLILVVAESTLLSDLPDALS